jgi:hypothetical protein
MSLTLTLEQNSREPIEAGNHIARCVQVIDLGHQLEKAFESEDTQLNHKIRVTWELPNEVREWTEKETGETKSRPEIISQEFKASLHEKSKLRKLLVSWRGRDFTEAELKGFELKNILNTACFLNVVHTEKDGKKYANISAVTPLAKGMTCPDQITELIYFDIKKTAENTFIFDQNLFDKLPKFIQEKLGKSDELKDTKQFDFVFETKSATAPTLDDSDFVSGEELPDIDLESIVTPF